MNIVFWFLCLIVATGLWLLFSVIFIPLGKIIIHKINNLQKTLTMETELKVTKEEKKDIKGE